MDSLASDLLRGEAVAESSAIDTYASAWISRTDHERYGIVEDSARITQHLVLSLLWWQDERQLIDLVEREERRAARRSDGRDDG